jgi:phospholipid transport system substrate-binding protein
MSNRILSRLIFPLLLVFISATAMAASDKDAEGFIQDLAQNAISSVAVENISDGDRDAQFRKVFVSNFDIPEIGKFVLARYWHNATPEQQASFLQIFEDTQVLTWSHRFKTYNGVKLVVLGANKDDATSWLVDTQIIRSQGQPLPVKWRVHEAPDGALRVTDILPESISMTMTFRDDYAGAMNANGGSIDALLSTMRGRNELLAAQAK